MDFKPIVMVVFPLKKVLIYPVKLLPTIHKVEVVFVLNNGDIINSGNHEFLIKNCDEYKSLYKQQLK